MGEDKTKGGWGYFWAGGLIPAAGAAGMWLLGSLRHQAQDRLLGSCVMTALLLACCMFYLRRECLYGGLDYNNGEHIGRFLGCFLIGLCVAFACGFLPVGGWPFLPVYVMLTLFGSAGTGLVVSSALLLTAVMLNGCGAEGFVVYFVSGVFAVTLFRHLGERLRTGIPLFLSLFCLLVCETASLILPTNARPDFEMFVIPAVNLVISGILLLGVLKLFFSVVAYRFRDRYLDINDTENPILVSLRESDRKTYMHCIHTSYFCERIGRQLGLDADALKCVGYYHHLAGELKAQDPEGKLPPAVARILTDYQNRKQGIRGKETAVLLCADQVMNSVTYLLENGEPGQIDYDRMIDALFRKLAKDRVFDRCDISVRELCTMQKIFKEEKLYYDFLR
ncbi:MAG: hypothetical protein NC432_02040 [Roseburia sp.]|nr:hypothetical protein [Roseburia sp.]MCM1097411.1 hypothetical protein [Ruminococcus flavefaciens]